MLLVCSSRPPKLHFVRAWNCSQQDAAALADQHGDCKVDLESYDAEFDTIVIMKTEFHENNNIFISHPDKHKRNWKIGSTINVTYAPIHINWARNKASNYYNQHQPASSFTTVSNVMVLLCEVRHQSWGTAFDSSKHHDGQKSNWSNKLSHLNRSADNGMKVSIMPLKTVIAHIGWVAMSIWMLFASSSSMYISSFSHSQQCHDSDAGPDVGRSAVGV